MVMVLSVLYSGGGCRAPRARARVKSSLPRPGGQEPGGEGQLIMSLAGKGRGGQAHVCVRVHMSQGRVLPRSGPAYPGVRTGVKGRGGHKKSPEVGKDHRPRGLFYPVTSIRSHAWVSPPLAPRRMAARQG